MYPMMTEWWKSYWDGMLSLPDSKSSSPSSSTLSARFAGYGYDIEDWPFENALCLLDDHLRIVSFTRNFRDVCGVHPEIGSEFHEVIVKEMHKAYFQGLQQVLFAVPSKPQSIMRARLAGEGMRFIEINGLPQNTGLMLTLRDVTREAEQERELARARINADLALRARSEFLGRMSHELRTPLNAVMGFAQMIESRIGGEFHHPVYEEYLRSILESGEHLREKIDNLVAISEAELGVLDLCESETSLQELLGKATCHHQHYAFSKDIQMNVGSADDIRLMADGDLLVKAISNLIDNALAATEPGGRILIEAEVLRSGEIALRVADNGIGMSGSLVQRLSAFFDGSVQGGSHYDQIPLGTGLVLVREYTLLHQGRLLLESRHGDGCVATILLPASRLVRSAAGARSVISAPRAVAV